MSRLPPHQTGRAGFPHPADPKTSVAGMHRNSTTPRSQKLQTQRLQMGVERNSFRRSEGALTPAWPFDPASTSVRKLSAAVSRPTSPPHQRAGSGQRSPPSSTTPGGSRPLQTLIASRSISDFATFGRLVAPNLRHEAETGSLTLRLTSSPKWGFTKPVTRTQRPPGYMANEQIP